MATKGQTVTVCRQGIPALEEPRVLFEANGKLYMSVAVVEYDPNHPQLTDAHKSTIKDLRSTLESGEPAKAVKLNLGEQMPAVLAVNTTDPSGPAR